jgi:hypothetical protein
MYTYTFKPTKRQEVFRKSKDVRRERVNVIMPEIEALKLALTRLES